MDDILVALQSNDNHTKQNGADNLIKLLNAKHDVIQFTPSDSKLKALIFGIFNLCRDASTKLSSSGLECLGLILRYFGHLFQSFVSVAFDVLILKFGDGKQIIRQQALDVAIGLINSAGLAVAFEKLFAHVADKNSKIREQILACILQLFEIYGDDVAIIPELSTKLQFLLNDSQNQIRQLAVSVFGKLYNLFGDPLLDELTANGIRSAQIKAIRDCVIKPPIECFTENCDDPCQQSAEVNVLASTNKGKTNSLDGLGEMNNNRPLVYDDLSSYVITERSTFDNENNKYSTLFYLPLLEEGLTAEVVKTSLDRDLNKILHTVQSLLQNLSDWQKRMKGLNIIQGLSASFSVGSRQQKDYFVAALRNMHELISTQISDLRSTVSKEACRTVAIVTKNIGSSVGSLIELLYPAIVKLLSVKIQVISAAADRCIRCVIYFSSPQGFTKMVTAMLETCANKNAIIRSVSLEYICLAISHWNSSAFSKYTGHLLRIVTSSLSDADSVTRCNGRQLYWLLNKVGFLSPDTMDDFYDKLEPSIQKHLQNEIRFLSPELNLLLQISNTTRMNMMKALTATHKERRIDQLFEDGVTESGHNDGNYRSLGVASRRVVSAFDEIGKKQPPEELLASDSVDSENSLLVDEISRSTFGKTIGSSRMGGARRLSVMASAKPKPEDSDMSIAESNKLPISSSIRNKSATRQKQYEAGFEMSRADLKTTDVNNAVKFTSNNSSMQEIRNLVNSANWENRVKAIHLILNTFVVEEYVNASQDQGELIDILLSKFSDLHQKVVFEALSSVLAIVSKSRNPIIASKFSNLLPALFLKCNDIKLAIKSIAQEILDYLKENFDVVAMISVLVSRITEFPERVRLHVFQFLLSIVIKCQSYFEHSQNTYAFLGRMAQVLSSSNKPSSSCLVAGKRLLELAYKTSPNILLSQISLLPFQQQAVIKGLLESSIPDIGKLVNTGESRPRTNSQISNKHGNSVNSVAENTTSISSEASTANTSTRAIAIQEERHKDIMWLLWALRPDRTAGRSECMEALREIKKLAKVAPDEYWQLNCAQIISVLLEAFNPVDLTTANHLSSPTLSRVPLTGLSPNVVSNENTIAISDNDPKIVKMESMHFACKVLLVIVQLRGNYVRPFMELLVSRLCQSADFAPTAVTIHCEEILGAVSQLDPIRFIKIILPFLQDSNTYDSENFGEIKNHFILTKSNDVQVRILALHSLCPAIKQVSTGQLCACLKDIISTVLPHFGSPLVDIRKAVVFVLVEVYLVVGDELYPFIRHLSPSQKKLITVYIERQMKTRNAPHNINGHETVN